MAAAIDLIDARGFAAASVDRIAQEAGTIKGTVLYHFKTKDAICAAVIAELYTRGAAFRAERQRDTESVRERLAHYLRTNLEFIQLHAVHVRAVQRILENAPGHREHIPDLLTPLAELLRDGQRAGEFARFDPVIAAAAIRALVDASAQYLANGGDTDIDHFFTEVMHFVDRATRAPATGNGEL